MLLFSLVFTEITCFKFLFFRKNLRFHEQHFLCVFIIYHAFTMSAFEHFPNKQLVMGVLISLRLAVHIEEIRLFSFSG